MKSFVINKKMLLSHIFQLSKAGRLVGLFQIIIGVLQHYY